MHQHLQPVSPGIKLASSSLSVWFRLQSLVELSPAVPFFFFFWCLCCHITRNIVLQHNLIKHLLATAGLFSNLISSQNQYEAHCCCDRTLNYTLPLSAKHGRLSVPWGVFISVQMERKRKAAVRDSEWTFSLRESLIWQEQHCRGDRPQRDINHTEENKGHDSEPGV